MHLPKLRIDQYATILLVLFLTFFRFDIPINDPSTNFLELIKPPPAAASLIVPIPKPDPQPIPEISAQAVMIYDPNHGAILYQKNAQQPLPIASLTKMMTGLLVVENYDLNEIVTIDGEENIEGNTIKLQRGEIITVDSLLHGLLIFSGNDAAYALANHHPRGLNGFIDQMNKKAQSLHLYQTSFDNPAGFDTANQYSTAYDLTILLKEVLEHPELQTIMGKPFDQVTSLDDQYTHAVYNTNELLKKTEGIVAGKTGSTPLAKECLVTKVERNGHTILTVMLGSDNRFGETDKLIDWTFDNIVWTNMSPEK